jgi:hypothetical protein
MTRILIETEIGVAEVHLRNCSAAERLVLRKIVEEAHTLLTEHNKSSNEGERT